MTGLARTSATRNARAMAGVQVSTLPACGHFSSLERPGAIARLIQEDA